MVSVFPPIIFAILSGMSAGNLPRATRRTSGVADRRANIARLDRSVVRSTPTTVFTVPRVPSTSATTLPTTSRSAALFLISGASASFFNAV